MRSRCGNGHCGQRRFDPLLLLKLGDTDIIKLMFAAICFEVVITMKSTRRDVSNGITPGAAGEFQASNGLRRIAEPVKGYASAYLKRPTRYARGMRPREGCERGEAEQR